MAYLNKTSQVLKAILTNKGRELLAQGNFNVTHFALADDEIDYTLWNTAHPSGSDYYGTVIENTPLLEPVPNETSVMRYKLLRDTSHLDVSAGFKMAVIGGQFAHYVNDTNNNGILKLNWNNGTSTGDVVDLSATTSNLVTSAQNEAYSYTLLNTNIAFLYLESEGEQSAGQFGVQTTPQAQSLRFRQSQTLISPSGQSDMKIKAKRITTSQDASKTTCIVTGLTSGATAALTVQVDYVA